MPKISVCIATYNGEKYIKEQLDSILPQLPNDAEVIISDDSSTDNTVQIIESFNDSRIHVWPNQKFRSPIFNFENALKHSHGDYIFLSDQDDVWMPDRIKKMLPLLNEFDLVVSDCKVVNDNQEVLMESFFERVKARKGFLRNLIQRSSYIGCCMAFKRKVLEKALPFPKNIPMHDFWIAMLAEILFKIKFIHEPLVLYRRHASNSSFTASESMNPIYKKIMFRLNTLHSLAIRLLRM
jgi:glycosyltransferase involved in cell wall biosynthesis